MPSRPQPASPQHPSSGWRARVLAGVATIALASSLTLAAPGLAQDGTGGAPPLEETACTLSPASPIAELLAGNDLEPSPAPDIAASPVASPAASPVASPVTATPVVPSASPVAATPVAPSASPVAVTPAASPAASPVGEAPRFDAALLTEDLTASATSLTSCLSESRFAQAADHAGPLFRGQLAGSGRDLPADDFASMMATFPETEYQIVEIANATLVDETTATADIVWQVGHQVRVDRWTFALQRVQGLQMWVVSQAEPGTLDPAREATTIGVIITNNAYTLDATAVEGDAVEFRVTNQDGIDHELLVLELDEGVTTDVLLTTPGPELPEGVTFIGQATIPGGGQGRLLLADLEPGTYTIVCLLPDASGLPHLAGGMEATFQIED